MGKIIAITNQKGGVGKTTTCINLGVGLARQGKRVLLIDFDPQGNTTQSLGYNPDLLEITVSNVLQRMIAKDQTWLQTEESCQGILHSKENVDLLPANIELATMEMQLLSVYIGREKMLANYIQVIKEFYDYILIDCKPSLDIITLNALTAADSVLIPVQAQFYSVKGLEQLLNTISQVVTGGLNTRLTICGILLTLVNPQTNNFKGIKQVVENAYGQHIKIYNTFIPRAVTAEEAPASGTSIYQYDAGGKVAAAYIYEGRRRKMSRSIPTVDVSNYAAIFTKPIFKNQNGEWFRDVGYADSLDIIRENVQGAAKSFIAIGYYLKHIRDRKLYLEGNYADIWECAQAEFGLSQSAASRYMSMNDTFSVNGDTPMLDEKYNDFNKSQLQEMLSLPEEKRETVNPQQTVSEIRGLAQQEKLLREPTEKDIKKFYEIHAEKYDEERSKLKGLLIENLGKSHSGGNSGGLNYGCRPQGIKIENADEITWAQLVKLINRYIPKKESLTGEEKLAVEEQQAVKGRLPAEEQLSAEEQLPGQMDIGDYLETGDYGNDDTETEENALLTSIAEMEENDRNQEEQQEPGTEQKPAVKYDAEFFLREQKKKLDDIIETSGVPEIVLNRQKTIVAALASMAYHEKHMRYPDNETELEEFIKEIERQC